MHAVTLTIRRAPITTHNTFFSYRRPNISSTVSPPFSGGTLQIVGSDFGKDNTQLVVNVVGNDETCGGETCNNPQVFDSGTAIQCQYGGVGSSLQTKKVVVTVNGQESDTAEYTYDVDRGEVTGIPAATQSVVEKDSIAYSLGLSIPPKSTVNINVTVDDSRCSVQPSVVTFAVGNTSSIAVLVMTTDNSIDEGTDETAYVCNVLHTITTDDPQYSSSAARTLILEVKNDDHADMKMRTINPTTDAYDYDVKFLPFLNDEGGNVSYGLRLDTEPKAPVTIRPNITLDHAEQILYPPVLIADPLQFVFDASNWNVTQRATIRSIPDAVDNARERFQIVHTIVTEDAVFLAKVTPMKVVVDLTDDDTAGICIRVPGTGCTSVVLNVNEGGEDDVFTFVGLTSEPLHNVSLYVDVPSDKITVAPNNITISQSSWQHLSIPIKLRALTGAPGGENKIHLRTVSDDPAYNSSKVGVDVTLVVAPSVTEPGTFITLTPPARSAWTYATFHVYSPHTNVDHFVWKVDQTPAENLDCDTQTCTVFIPKLLYGKHRFEVRSVARAGEELKSDTSPAYFEWVISHCNDLSRVPSQYAQINGSNGALECIDCPHPEGANCLTSDIEWEGVFANPGWWTAGNRNDTYYKCPFRGTCIGGCAPWLKKTCLGGNISSPQNNTAKIAVKSRCSPGSHGVVCAVCDDKYFLVDDRCIPCPTKNGDSKALVAVTFSVALGGFMFALLRQMRVRDSKEQWKAARGSFHRAFTNKSLTTSVGSNVEATEKKMRTYKKIKTFIGFVQILSVCESAYKIPWPKGFLFFIRMLWPFNFDLLALSRLGCLVDYNFFHSYAMMVSMPLIMAVLIAVVYFVGLIRHKKHYGHRFTHAMHATYKNHVIVFLLWIVLLISPPLSRRTIEYFACSEEIDGRFYLRKDYTVECFTDEWNRGLPIAIIFVALYPLGIPIYFAFKLFVHRHQLDDDMVIARYGFLYSAYRRGAYLWDVWELLQKLFLTGVIFLIAPGTTFQVVVVVMANLCFLSFLIIEKPHKAGGQRNLAMIASFAITITMYLGFVLIAVDEAKDDKYSMVFDVLLIGVNGFVVVYMLYTVCVPVIMAKTRALKEKRKAKNVQVVPAKASVEEQEKKVLKLMTFSKKQSVGSTIGATSADRTADFSI